MFTGIIEQLGTIYALTPTASGLRLEVAAADWAYVPARGDSIAINGTCLTAIAPTNTSGVISFDVVPETLEKTTLGTLRVGDRVNLEHAATMQTLLGGHMVQGHVDGVGEVEAIETQNEWRITIRPPRHLMKYLAPKGSICLDGVSLTLAHVVPPTPSAQGFFQVVLIPTTLEKTTLGKWAKGTRMNIEADSMAKTIVNYLEHFAQKN